MNPPAITRVRDRGALRTIGIAFNTKDRVDLSRRTVGTALGESGCDAYWMDGSSTEEGRALPDEFVSSLGNLREIHHGVVGGPDAAIVYSLKHLLGEGHDFVGLVENDVLLEPGWLPRVMRLFELGREDGLHVGAATARTYDRRMLFQTGRYAVMLNIGAGMIVFTRAAAELVLATFRSCTLEELAIVAGWATGSDVTSHWEFRTGNLPGTWCSADWNFDRALMLNGYASLGCVPSPSRNIDADLSVTMGIREVQSTSTRGIAASATLGEFKERLEGLARGKANLPRGYLHHSAAFGLYTVFPHQLDELLPGSVSGEWRRKWTQGFGPFTYVAGSVACGLKVPVYGGAVFLILGKAPDGGSCDVTWNGKRTHIDLTASQPEQVIVEIDAPAFSRSELVVQVTGAGMPWYGLQFGAEQPWFTEGHG